MNPIEKIIVEHSFDGLCLIDNNGDCLYMNQNASKICSFSIHEFVGGNVKNALKDGDINDSIALKVLRHKRPISGVVTIRGVDVLITGSPVFDANKQVDKVVLNIRDINELNNLRIDQILSLALKNKPVHDDFSTEELPEIAGVVAKSKAFRKVLKMVYRIAKVDSSVYLQGESGVGKEVIVNLLHKASARADKPLIKVNCSAIPAQLLESELFGYEKGAFTGADQRGKPGLFEQANGGIIFLDEIGDMPLDLQAKILRVLQEYEIMRIGGRKSIQLNVRVVSATNKDLEALVKEGKFRLDLFYRLNIVPIFIPPLRDRPEDTAPLAHYFLQQKNKKYGLKVKFAPGSIQLFNEYDWPGNVREMENMIERLVVTSENNEISWSDLPFIKQSHYSPLQQPLKSILLEIEKKIIYQKLELYKTTRKTAEALGISQSALVKKMKRFQLNE